MAQVHTYPPRPPMTRDILTGSFVVLPLKDEQTPTDAASTSFVPSRPKAHLPRRQLRERELVAGKEEQSHSKGVRGCFGPQCTITHDTIGGTPAKNYCVEQESEKERAELKEAARQAREQRAEAIKQWSMQVQIRNAMHDQLSEETHVEEEDLADGGYINIGDGFEAREDGLRDSWADEEAKSLRSEDLADVSLDDDDNSLGASWDMADSMTTQSFIKLLDPDVPIKNMLDSASSSILRETERLLSIRSSSPLPTPPRRKWGRCDKLLYEHESDSDSDSNSL